MLYYDICINDVIIFLKDDDRFFACMKCNGLLNSLRIISGEFLDNKNPTSSAGFNI